MKRSFVLLLTGLALCSGLSDAARRSGGGFGGSSSSSRSSSSSSGGGSTYRAPSSGSSSRSTPSYTPPRNSSSGSTYTAPRTSTSSRTPTTTQRSAGLPSTASVRNSPLNTAAASKVTATQLSNWNKTSLPAGVPRSAITYSATPSSQYRYQLQPGRYFPYPQSYYRQHSIGYDILKYALIFTAVGSIADAMTPASTQGDLSDMAAGSTVVVRQNSGPNIWTYVGVGFFAAAAGWFLMGRKSSRK